MFVSIRAYHYRSAAGAKKTQKISENPEMLVDESRSYVAALVELLWPQEY